jgi:hypothetical protein
MRMLSRIVFATAPDPLIEQSEHRANRRANLKLA